MKWPIIPHGNWMQEGELPFAIKGLMHAAPTHDDRNDEQDIWEIRSCLKLFEIFQQIYILFFPLSNQEYFAKNDEYLIPVHSAKIGKGLKVSLFFLDIYEEEKKKKKSSILWKWGFTFRHCIVSTPVLIMPVHHLTLWSSQTVSCPASPPCFFPSLQNSFTELGPHWDHFFSFTPFYCTVGLFSSP